MEQEPENREKVAEERDEDPEPVVMRARIAELERNLSEREAEITGLKQQADALGGRCRELEGTLSGAVQGYRSLVLKTNPEVPEEMVNGNGIGDIDASLKKAKDLVGRVRQGIEAEISRTKVPAGAPERGTHDLSALSPGEKIRYGLGGND